MAGEELEAQECVLREELTRVLDDHRHAINDDIDRKFTETNATLQQLNESIAMLNTRIDGLANQPPNNGRVDPQGAAHDHEPDNDNEMRNHDAFDAQQRNRLNFNRQGMRGNNFQQHNARVNDDPYAKVKFTVPSFAGAYDAEIYLDWEMTVEQKFNAHLVPEVHRVRQATSEFKNFAIIWWNRVCTDGLAPTTWDALKVAMRNRFVPPAFKRDLRKKLQRLNQGNRSVEEYYQELQISMLRCDIIEDEEAAMARFYGGLGRGIQDIVDYKEYDSVPRLFHLACLAEKELQGRQQRPRNYFGSTSTPRSTDRKSVV